VETVTLAVPLPLVSIFGLTMHVVDVAETGKVHDKLT